MSPPRSLRSPSSPWRQKGELETSPPRVAPVPATAAAGAARPQAATLAVVLSAWLFSAWLLWSALETRPLAAALPRQASTPTRATRWRAMGYRERVPAAHWRHASGTRSKCREIACRPCGPVIIGRHGTKRTAWARLARSAADLPAAGWAAAGMEVGLSKIALYSPVQYQGARPISRLRSDFLRLSISGQ